MMNNIVVYENGEIELEISVDSDTIWLSGVEIAKLFNTQRPAIVKHIGNIYKTSELDKISTCSILEQVARDGKKRKVNHYNLDMIIAVGYRVNSKLATHFRRWATSILKRYLTDGYAINSEKITHQRFKELEGNVSNLKTDMQNIKSKVKDDKLETMQGVFYNGEIYDAYVLINNIFKSSQKSIVVIDKEMLKWGNDE